VRLLYKNDYTMKRTRWTIFPLTQIEAYKFGLGYEPTPEEVAKAKKG